MVVISDEVTSIFKILAIDVKNEQDLFSVLVPRDLLLRVDVEQQLTLLIDSLKEEGKTVIVVHHDLHEINEMFDQVLLINMRLVAYGQTKDVMSEKNLGP